jgi:hypothetical protein
MVEPTPAVIPVLPNLGAKQSNEPWPGMSEVSTSPNPKSAIWSDLEWNEKLRQVDEDCGTLAVLLMMCWGELDCAIVGT